MSTIKSSDEHLTLNADGTSKDIKFQANGVEKASLSSTGVFTATSFAGSGAALTGVGVAGISSSADATAMTILSNERIGINHTTPEARLEIDGGSETGLMVRSTVAAEYPAIFQSASTGSVPITDFRNNGGTSQLKVMSDGRGLSQFTAKAWCRFNGNNNSIIDSHNISSVTDNGTGQYYVNIDVNMANANYLTVVSSTWPTWDANVHCGDQAVGTVNVYTVRAGGSNVYQDNPNVSCLVFGD